MSKRIDWLVTELHIPGGAEHFIRNMAPRIRQLGWDLHVIVLQPGGLLVDELRHLGVPVTELGMSGKTDLGAFFRLVNLWRSNSPTIVHTHLYHAGILGRCIARLVGIHHVLVHQHGPELNRSHFRTLVDRVSSPLVTRYITTCNAVAGMMEKREGISPTKITVIPNGVSVPPNIKITKPTGWPVPEGHLSIACVGRLVKEKGQKYLLEALAMLGPNHPPLHVVFLGDGPLRQILEAYSREKTLGSQVSFIGYQPNIWSWLPNFDIFILPSEWEGVSLALLEAMACALPVIATSVGGTPEVVLDGVTGILVPPANPDLLVKAIQILAINPELREKLGSAGKERFFKHYQADEVSRQLSALYEGL